MSDAQPTSEELCKHWRRSGAGRVLNAEYAGAFACTYCEIEKLKRLLPEEEITEVPIKLMFEKINEIAEDMYLSGVTTSDEDLRLQAIFEEIAARHGITFEDVKP